MNEIIVVGSLNMDLVMRIAHMPKPGETIHGKDFKMIPGGKGANQAAAIAHMDGKVAMVGRVGDDVFGSQLIKNLQKFGVDTQHIITDPETPTGTAAILVDDQGENSIVVTPGANGCISPEDVARLESVITRAHFLVTQFEIPLQAVRHAVQMAHAYGVKVVLNPSPAYVEALEMLSMIDYLILNETEAEFLGGLKVSNLTSATLAARKLLEKGGKVIILTLGENGALLVTRDKEFHIPTRKVKTVDSTAAGDAFIGGFVTSLVHGQNLEDAVEFANSAGSIAVTRLGAQTSLPSFEEVMSMKG